MSLTRVDPATLEKDIERHEARTEKVMGAAVRGFLTQVTDAAIDSLPAERALVAAGTPITLGEMAGWWDVWVTQEINPAIRAIWVAGYDRRTDAVMTASSLDELATYMGAVNDRLVRGLTPPLPDAAFDTVRLAITSGAARGLSTKDTANLIAKSLAWETNGPYWRQQLAAADAAIDAILDPLGPPGNPAREAARLRDPRVDVWQQARATAVRHLDAEGTYWRNRATLIARTESTGAYNYGALNALVDEGVQCKEWLATSDSRTRLTHRQADGQVVRVRSKFSVGGSLMMMPGDPTAPPAEVCNCRCTIVQAPCS